MSYLDGINMALMELITKGKAPSKEPKNIPVKPKPEPEIVKAEPVLEPKETLLVKPDANLKELNEIINWGKELTKIENITGDVALENQDGESGLAERYECPICGIEVAEGIIFCPNCKARFSQPKE
jgi:rubrerythrin